MRFIVFSDLHLHPWNYGSTVDEYGRNSRLWNQRDVLYSLLRYAEENSIKQIFFGGDFFHAHNNIPTEALIIASDFRMSLNHFNDDITESYYIAGNHDIIDRRGIISSIGLLTDEHAYTSSKHWGEYNFADITLRCIPYKEEKDDLLRALDNTRDGTILLMHQGVSGVSINSKGFTLNEILEPSMIPDNVLAAFAGHYHSHKKVRDNFWIPGSPMQLTWADKGERRGWLDVTIEDNNEVNVKLVPSDAPRFVEISGKDMMGCHSTLAEYVRGNFVRLTGKDLDVEGYRKKLKEMEAASVEIIDITKYSDNIDEVNIWYGDNNKQFLTPAKAVSEYIDVYKLSKEVATVGESIVNETYEAPKLKS